MQTKGYRRIKNLTDFNSKSTCLELLYTKRLENQIYYTFIFTFLLSSFLMSFFFFSHGPIKYGGDVV